MNKREIIDIGDTNPAIAISSLVVPARGMTIEVSDWTVARGACVALVGPNGAGKTTIIEAILGLRRATALKGKVLGVKLPGWNRRTDMRRRLGVQLQGMALPFGLYIRDLVELHRSLYDRSSQVIIEALGIPQLADKVYERLSRGEMQRIELFLALAHRPDLIILDEPFTGLDQQFAQATAELLRDLMAEGSTIVMACHSPPELALADKVAWINGGRLRTYMEPEALRHHLLGEFRFHASFSDQHAANDMLGRITANVTPRFTRSITETEYAMFGDEALVEIARGLVKDEDIVSIEFGRTTPSDLLLRCAQDEYRV